MSDFIQGASERHPNGWFVKYINRYVTAKGQAELQNVYDDYDTVLHAFFLAEPKIKEKIDSIMQNPTELVDSINAAIEHFVDNSSGAFINFFVFLMKSHITNGSISVDIFDKAYVTEGLFLNNLMIYSDNQLINNIVDNIDTIGYRSAPEAVAADEPVAVADEPAVEHDFELFNLDELFGDEIVGQKRKHISGGRRTKRTRKTRKSRRLGKTRKSR